MQPSHSPFTLDGVLYDCRLERDGTFRVEFLDARCEELLEAGPEEFGRMLTGRRLPLTGVEPEAFYGSMHAAARDRLPWAMEFGYVGPLTGRPRWLRAQHVPRPDADDSTSLAGLLIDVTAVREAARLLLGASATLNSHIENTPLAVIEWDREMRVVRWSGQAAAIFGWESADVLGKRPGDWRFVHDEDAARIEAVVKRLLDGTEPRNVIFNRNYTRAGEIAFCEWHNSATLDAGGGTASILSLVLDLTDRHKASVELSSSETRLRTALNFSGMLSWETDLAAAVTHYSSDPAAFFGLTDATVPVGYSQGYQCVHPEERARVFEAMASCVRTGHDLDFEFRGPTPGPDGQPRWFHARGRPVRDAAGVVVRSTGVTQEVTGRKGAEAERAALERELQQARNHQTLGVLAGGIAHDFNNLLTVVLGNVGLLRLLSNEAPVLARHLSMIEDSAQRGAELCRQMTAYAGVGRVLVREVELPKLLEELRPALASAAGPSAGLALDLGATLPTITGDAAQIRQLLTNLVLNAAEALPPAGGRVVVRARPVALGAAAREAYRPVPQFSHGLSVQVIDDGHGMEAEVLARIFEPFFTTRFTGRGLGLPAVLGIARTHHASIRVQSEAGRGTTVELLFPVRQVEAVEPGPDAARVSKSPADRAAPSASRGVALVVDDEAEVRRVTAALLEGFGYAVETAANGAEGLARFLLNPAAYQIVFLDLVMPVMSGQELLAEVRKCRPELPVVLMSGYVARAVEACQGDLGVTHALAKPFRIEDLRRAVAVATGATSVAPPS